MGGGALAITTLDTDHMSRIFEYKVGKWINMHFKVGTGDSAVRSGKISSIVGCENEMEEYCEEYGYCCSFVPKYLFKSLSLLLT